MPSDTPEITDTTAFTHGSLAKQVLFTVLTLGLYPLYWWYSTSAQLNRGTSADCSPGLRTVGLFVPIYNIVVMWRFSHDAAAVTDQDGVILFVLLLVFGPAAWYLIQTGINEVATGAT